MGSIKLWSTSSTMYLVTTIDIIVIDACGVVEVVTGLKCMRCVYVHDDFWCWWRSHVGSWQYRRQWPLLRQMGVNACVAFMRWVDKGVDLTHSPSHPLVSHLLYLIENSSIPFSPNFFFSLLLPPSLLPCPPPPLVYASVGCGRMMVVTKSKRKWYDRKRPSVRWTRLGRKSNQQKSSASVVITLCSSKCYFSWAVAVSLVNREF